MTTTPHDELLERARRTIRELRDRLNVAEARNRVESIAVIGMAVQLPGSGSDLEKFWKMIRDGEDAIRPIPSDRWDGNAFYAAEPGTPGKINTRYAAFLDDVRRFDAAFFDIAPREAIRMDPQQRVFLETAWHALEHAGLPKSRISGTDTGVFVGVHSHSVDYREMQFRDLTSLDAYSGTGTAHDMISGRLAYWLDLHGPAVVVDTACSSSLTAIHYACRSLRAGDCTVALAGGVNLMLTPASTVSASQLELLAPDGRSKTFDARADGMGRGEGCGVVVLKNLDMALRHGDRVLAILRGSAINQDGRTNGLTAPNGLSQQRVLRKALEDARIAPYEIGYVEAHGTGTALGDPIEVEALAEVVGEGGAKRTTPCHLGSIKANIGHLEGAAGVVGLIKTVLVLRNRWRPPVANLRELNPHFSLKGVGLEIAHTGSAWLGSPRRVAGVSSFGWSGTNVHVVLEEAPESNDVISVKGVWPFVVSARSQKALQALAIECADLLERSAVSEFFDLCYTSTVRRSAHPYRIAVYGGDAVEIATKLRNHPKTSEGRCSDQLDASRTGDFVEKNVKRLVSTWELGEDVDWNTSFPTAGRLVDLPRYPFEGRSHWLEDVEPDVPVGVPEPVENDWVYKTKWIEKPLKPLPSMDLLQKGGWLLVCPESPEGEQFAHMISEAIQELGDRVIIVRKGSTFDDDGYNKMMLGAAFADDFEEALRRTAKEGIELRRILFLAGDQEIDLLVEEALKIAQAVVKSQQPLKIWYITLGAEDLQLSSQPIYPAQSAMRGLSRVFGMEYPDLSGGIIDIDVADLASVRAICADVLQGSDEDRVALRQGKRWVARLGRYALNKDYASLQLKPDRCYLVTGAFGRLGMEIASWLVSKGARHLALIGRRGPAEINSLEIAACLTAWRGLGITILAEPCNVAEEGQLQALIARIQAGPALLAGLIHAAAGFRLRPIPELERQDISLVFDAKLRGAKNLDRCTYEIPLDFFVLFSSAAATLGPKTGALYAASNSSLDALVVGRKKLGLPVLCIEWGLWKTADDVRKEDLFGRSVFFEAMSSAKALELLDILISTRVTTCIVANIDWNILTTALEMRGRHALISEIVGRDHAILEGDNSDKTRWSERLEGLPEEDRRCRLADFVGDETRTVFKMKPEDALDENRGFFQMGMDSLMSVRLKRRIELGTGMKLPGTLTLTYPTVTAIAEYLDEKLFPRRLLQEIDKDFSTPQITVDSHELAVAVTDLSDIETDMAIAAELAAIQKKLGAC